MFIMIEGERSPAKAGLRIEQDMENIKEFAGGDYEKAKC